MLVRILCLICLALPLAAAEADSPPERELIQDPHFKQGFILWKTEPGRHIRYGELKGLDASAKPAWGLDQWSSKFPLGASGVMRDGALVYSNNAKAVILAPAGNPATDLTLAINTGVEYGSHSRKSPSEPWVHLLVEQEFANPPFLERQEAVRFHVEARLLRSRFLQGKDYTPDLHAAQFQIYLTVQNRNHQSPGYGDLLWFGVPIYDNRSRFPKAFKEQDFGGTAKYIHMPDGREFTETSAHDGNWLVIDKDIKPMLVEALATAWSRGFLKASKNPDDYAISGIYMGWELPGTFDVSMQVRDLSLKTRRRAPVPGAAISE